MEEITDCSLGVKGLETICLSSETDEQGGSKERLGLSKRKKKSRNKTQDVWSKTKVNREKEKVGTREKADRERAEPVARHGLGRAGSRKN